MLLLQFLLWAIFVLVTADLIGVSLQRAYPTSFGETPLAAHATAGQPVQGSGVDFASSTLLGFAALWCFLSLLYALGMATLQVMVVSILLAAIVGAASCRAHLFHWMRSRWTCWLVLGLAIALALFIKPRVNEMDDPPYLYLVEKLLGTGSLVEYFNYRRPITLGGWTFIQALFSAGPAGTAFVASVDYVLGSVLFLLCALLLRLGRLAAVPVALCGILVVHSMQTNLGSTVSMAALCALLVVLSLPERAESSPFTTMTFAVIAASTRPQLGLIACLAVAISLWRHRSGRLGLGIASLAGIALIWLFIFYRDTGLLPTSVAPGYNPFLDPGWQQFQGEPVAHKLLKLWNRPLTHTVATLLAASMLFCAWQAWRLRRTGKSDAMWVWLAFAIAAMITALLIIKLDPVLALQHARYFVPVLQGVLFAFLVWVGTRALQRAPWLGPSAVTPLAILFAVLVMVDVVVPDRIAPPHANPANDCPRLLQDDELSSIGQLPSVKGLTMLMIECPLGNFAIKRNTMTSDLFFMTRGASFDLDWTWKDIVAWLQDQGVSRFIYLENDASPIYGLEPVRERLADYISSEEEYRSWEFDIWLRSLEIPRRLADHCARWIVPITHPEGPVIVVDIDNCDNT